MTYMTVQVITPDGIRYDHHANYISIKTPDGEMGILPDHINLIAPLTVHEMKIRRTDDENHVDWIAINADSAERERDIDVSRAERAKIRAERSLEKAQSNHDIDEVRRAQVALRRALNRISVGNNKK